MSPKKEKDGEKKNFSEQIKEITEAIENPAENIGLEEKNTVEELEKELGVVKEQCADYLEKLRRNMAEFDNFRKRTAKEKATVFDEGVREVVEKLIPILDNFDLAINAATNREDNFYKGVEMILRQFRLMLFDIGVEDIPALGEQFDPGLHNAVVHVNDDTFGDNEIVEEMRKGYKYKDKIIRHTMVKVAN